MMPLMTAKEYASQEHIKKSEKTIQEYCRDGLLEHEKQKGKYMIYRDALLPHKPRKKKNRIAKDHYRDILCAVSAEKYVNHKLLGCTKSSFDSYLLELINKGYIKIKSTISNQKDFKNFIISTAGETYLKSLKKRIQVSASTGIPGINVGAVIT